MWRFGTATVESPSGTAGLLSAVRARNAWILTQRELLHWVRQPALPIFGRLFSIMLLLMFAFLFGGAIDVPGGGDDINFLLPGMFTLTMLFGLDGTPAGSRTKHPAHWLKRSAPCVNAPDAADPRSRGGNNRRLRAELLGVVLRVVQRIERRLRRFLIDGGIA